MLYLLQDSLEDVHTSIGHVDLGLLVVRRHKVIVTLTGVGRKGERVGEREREGREGGGRKRGEREREREKV